tara:strand:- start:3149 stop:4222 length:1074 start_codon:yes stop_codon:yes gene_type:complete
VSDATFKGAFRTDDEIKAFQLALNAWFRECGKDYPWRRTTDPYAILVSELMLQQTQIVTVLSKGYYTRWMRKFPDWRALAEAEEDDVLKAWEGLGYYNRARNLQKTAQRVCRDFEGRFPEDLDQIRSLPGVGRYTAGALLSFAYDRRAPIVDGNVARVLSRLFAFREPIDVPASNRLIWEWAELLTPEREVRIYNSAIMELGQRVCIRGVPECDSCPVREWCRGVKEGGVGDLPLKKAKVGVTQMVESVIIRMQGHNIFLVKEQGKRRRGLWRLPEVPEEAVADQNELFRFDYAITRYRVNLRVFGSPAFLPEVGLSDEKGDWFDLKQPEKLPALGSPYLKAIKKYQNLHDDLPLNG